MEESKHVVIVGAGLIGVLTAYFIAKRGEGIRVTVLERSNEVAAGTSFANAGRFALANYIQGPTARPDKVGLALSTLVPAFLRTGADKAVSPIDNNAPTPPFVVKQNATLTPNLVEWGIWFLRNCTPGAFEYNKHTTSLLSQHALDSMDSVLAEIELQKIHEVGPSGVTVFSKSQKFDDAATKAHIINSFGEQHQEQGGGSLRPSWEVLSCSECLKRYTWLQQFHNTNEPSVPTGEQLERNIAGCIANGEFTVDARAFTQEVAKLAVGTGRVQFRFNEEVDRVEVVDNKARGVILADGATQIPADEVVLCAGPWTRRLVSPFLGLTQSLPLEYMRGCSVDLLGCSNAPSTSVVDGDSGDLYYQAVPFRDARVRVIGYADFVPLGDMAVGGDLNGTELLKEKLLEYTRYTLPQLQWTATSTPWIGWRPMVGEVCLMIVWSYLTLFDPASLCLSLCVLFAVRALRCSPQTISRQLAVWGPYQTLPSTVGMVHSVSPLVLHAVYAH
jgi:D-amino-acid dehydrogenase